MSMGDKLFQKAARKVRRSFIFDIAETTSRDWTYEEGV